MSNATYKYKIKIRNTNTKYKYKYKIQNWGCSHGLPAETTTSTRAFLFGLLVLSSAPVIIKVSLRGGGRGVGAGRQQKSSYRGPVCQNLKKKWAWVPLYKSFLDDDDDDDFVRRKTRTKTFISKI